MKSTFTKLTIAATLGLALALTLSCKKDSKQAAECDEGFSSETQFCFKSKIYERCGREGIEYNPETQFCGYDKIHDKCGGKEYNSETESCSDGKISAVCGEKTYNPSEEDCCYGTIYNPSTHFCSDISFDSVDKCGGKEYNLETQICDNGEVKNSQ
ncbi:MAG: hypothetical protein FWF63_03965 [Fibromonadales bacterium]|nr:hypothetical protein [Fibromonadales bacterium]